jgi:hypothetical protein
MQFATAAAERMRIDSSGNVEVKGGQELRVYRGDNATYGSMKYLTGSGGLQLNDKNGDGISFVQADGATEYGRFDASGNFGIGTSPSNKLDIKGTVGFEATNSTNKWLAYTYTDNTLRLNYNGSGADEVVLDSSGNVGIGVTPESWNTYKTLQIGNGAIANYTPTHDMRMVSNAYYNSGWKYAESDGACLYLQDGNNSQHIWSVAASGTADAALTWSEAMRIDASGNLALGDSNAYTHRLFVKGVGTNEAVGLAVGTNGNNIIRFYNSGLGTAGAIKVNSGGTTVAYNTSSDQRLKENIADADDAGNKVDSIQVRKFDWKADGSHQDYGMVAQELQTVAPEAVSGDADSDEMMGVDYSKLVPMLVKEIQSLRARVAQLEN